MEKRVFETFREFDDAIIYNWTDPEPCCHCGKVYAKKYRVTIEEIEAPVEVMLKRIKELAGKIHNKSELRALKVLGEKYGLELGWRKIVPIN